MRHTVSWAAFLGLLIATGCKRGREPDTPPTPAPTTAVLSKAATPPASAVPAAQDQAPVPEGIELVGTWEGTSGAGNMREVWTISRDDSGTWSVAGSFQRDGREVGSFRGQNAQLSNGTLTFTQQYVQKPDRGWSDGNVITARADAYRLSFTWRSSNRSGQNALARVGQPPVALTAPPARPASTEPSPTAPEASVPPLSKDLPPPPGFRKKPAEPAAPPSKPKDEGPPPLTAEGKDELAKIEGTWVFKDFILDGKKIDFGATWKFKDGFVGEYIGLTTPRRSGWVRLDPSQNPRAIDINFTKGQGGAPLGLNKGIYEIDGDRLTICLATEGPRPTEMESTPAHHRMLVVFRRE